MSFFNLKDLITIIKFEYKVLLRGFFLSFFVILPFTFLPVIFKKGTIIRIVIARVNDSIFYSILFSILIVVVALLYNYIEVAKRKWYFDKPAFSNLEFYGRVDGHNSLIYNLETFLLGKIGNYFFRLNLDNIIKETLTLEIIPLISIDNNKEGVLYLMREYNFKKNFFFSMNLSITNFDLDNPHFIKNILIPLEKDLNIYRFESLDVNEKELENDLL